MKITLSKCKSGYLAHVQEFHMSCFGYTREEALTNATNQALPKLALQHKDLLELAKKYLEVVE